MGADMDPNEEQRADDQLKAQKEVYEFVQPFLDRAFKVYEQAITSLWVGNASATLATLSFIGATWSNGEFPRALLWPLVIFLAGVVAMAIGSIVALVSARTRIERMARANSIRKFLCDDIKSPTEEIGLTLSDWRTRMAVLSGALFIIGCVVGLVQLGL